MSALTNILAFHAVLTNDQHKYMRNVTANCLTNSCSYNTSDLLNKHKSSVPVCVLEVTITRQGPRKHHRNVIWFHPPCSSNFRTYVS